MRSHPPPDVIVINTHLPEMDGLLAVNLFRKTSYMRTIKLIVTSHSGDEALVTMFAEHDIEDCLLKPFDDSVIKTKIEKILAPQYLQ